MNKLDIRNIRLADFDDDFNKTRQSASDVIPTLAKKISTTETRHVQRPALRHRRADVLGRSVSGSGADAETGSWIRLEGDLPQGLKPRFIVRNLRHD